MLKDDGIISIRKIGWGLRNPVEDFLGKRIKCSIRKRKRNKNNENIKVKGPKSILSVGYTGRCLKRKINFGNQRAE